MQEIPVEALRRDLEQNLVPIPVDPHADDLGTSWRAE
jgi:hypothetical protein